MILILVSTYSERAVTVIYTQPEAIRRAYSNLQYQQRGSALDAHPLGGRRFFAHLHGYPRIRRLTLDFSTCRADFEPTFADDAASRNGHLVRETGHHGIQHLRIKLPHQYLMDLKPISTVFNCLAQTTAFPNLRKLHITMTTDARLRLNFSTRKTNTNTQLWTNILNSLDPIATSWRHLDTIQLCAWVRFGAGEALESTENIWVSTREHNVIFTPTLRILILFFAERCTDACHSDLQAQSDMQDRALHLLFVVRS
jgi:hypothetical protein